MVKAGNSLVWYAEVPRSSCFIEENVALLTATEKERRQSFTCLDARAMFTSAHILARYLASMYLDIPVDSVELLQICEQCGGPHGKPSIRHYSDISISWSHTHGAVMAGISKTRIGVDVERYSAEFLPSDDVLKHAMSKDEIDTYLNILENCGRQEALMEFIRVWTYKECLVKTGTLDLGCFSVHNAPTRSQMSQFDLTSQLPSISHAKLGILLVDYERPITGCVASNSLVEMQNKSVLFE